LCECLRANFVCTVGSLAGNREASGEYAVAGPPRKRIGFTSQKRLIDLQVARFKDHAVGDYRLAGHE